MHAPNYVIFGMQIWLTGEGHVWLYSQVFSLCLSLGDCRRRLRIMDKLLKLVRKDTRDVLFSNYRNVSVRSSISFFSTHQFSCLVLFCIFTFFSHMLGRILIGLSSFVNYFLTHTSCLGVTQVSCSHYQNSTYVLCLS